MKGRTEICRTIQRKKLNPFAAVFSYRPLLQLAGYPVLFNENISEKEAYD